MQNRWSVMATLLLSLLLNASLSDAVNAQAVRTQTVHLQEGWNAVYLEVDPLTPDPAVLFADTPVDIVAAYVAPRSGAQFIHDPQASLLATYGWRVWYAPRRSDHFLSRLFALYGATPYLLHAGEEATLQVTGHIPVVRRTWVPNAYNFVGFTVQDPGGPTFRQFFEPSKAHHHNRIYRLKDGTWRQVLDPAAAVMRQGEAFWIYTKGRSNYSGPLQVTTPLISGVAVSQHVGASIIVNNRAPHPISAVVDHLVDGNDAVPLDMSVKTIDTSEEMTFRTMAVPLEAGAWTQPLPVLEAGAGLRLPFTLRVKDAAPGLTHSILRVTTDLGTIDYVPVTARNEEFSTVQNATE